MKQSHFFLISLGVHLAAGLTLWQANMYAISGPQNQIVDLTYVEAPAVLPKQIEPKIIQKSLEKVPQKAVEQALQSSLQATLSDQPAAISEVTRLPRVVKEYKAVRSEESKKTGTEGAVVLSVVIDREGKVRDVEIVKGVEDRLNQLAKEALKNFEFEAARKGQDPVSVRILYTYRFKLDAQ